MRRTFLLLGLTALLCCSVVAQQHSRRLSRNSFGQADAQPVYQKWLNEDVAYIITAEERRAFTALRTNAEREQFIESFWRRRDPQPETDENEYRAEYYARIAHVNQQFAFGNVAGWRTDRGRIYLTYGRPDEVQKTASGEVWLYKGLPGLGSNVRFEFVDATGAGDFRLRQ
jgi:GWxTD domain-containing protein